MRSPASCLGPLSCFVVIWICSTEFVCSFTVPGLPSQNLLRGQFFQFPAQRFPSTQVTPAGSRVWPTALKCEQQGTPSRETGFALKSLHVEKNHHQDQHENSDFARARRGLLQAVAGAIVVGTLDLADASTSQAVAPQPAFLSSEDSVVIPLFYCGGSYCMTFNIDSHGPFRAVVDTGSPFFTVAGSCTKRWGCFNGEGTSSELKPTWEVFAAKEGIVKWRQGRVTFPNATGSAAAELGAISGVRGGLPLTFGVLPDSMVSRPGGVFLGLVRERELDIRPTFLGQTDFTSIQIDLSTRRKSLTLSRTSLLSPSAAVPIPASPLVDLRPYGDPVQHYACVASEVRSNGRALETQGKQVYVIFDTGTTGFTMSRELYEEELSARADRPRRKEDGRPWADVRVRFPAEDGSILEVAASDPITTPVDIPWPKFDGHLLIVGLSFLEGSVLTVDTASKRLSVDQTRRSSKKQAGFDPSDCFQSKRGTECTMTL